MSDDDHDSFGGMPSPGGPPSPGSRPGTPTNIESAVAGVMGIASALSPSRPHSSASHPKSPRRTNDDRAAEGPERSMQGIARHIESVLFCTYFELFQDSGRCQAIMHTYHYIEFSNFSYWG